MDPMTRRNAGATLRRQARTLLTLADELDPPAPSAFRGRRLICRGCSTEYAGPIYFRGAACETAGCDGHLTRKDEPAPACVCDTCGDRRPSPAVEGWDCGRFACPGHYCRTPDLVHLTDGRTPPPCVVDLVDSVGVTMRFTQGADRAAGPVPLGELGPGQWFSLGGVAHARMMSPAAEVGGYTACRLHDTRFRVIDPGTLVDPTPFTSSRVDLAPVHLADGRTLTLTEGQLTEAAMHAAARDFACDEPEDGWAEHTPDMVTDYYRRVVTGGEAS